jgi:hypothetical protein
MRSAKAASSNQSLITVAPGMDSTHSDCLRNDRAEAAFDPLPFDGEMVRAYGREFAAKFTKGWKTRGTQALDLLIAATGCTATLPIDMHNR